MELAFFMISSLGECVITNFLSFFCYKNAVSRTCL